MARGIFIIFIILVISLGVLDIIAITQNRGLIKQADRQRELIDSLQSECFVKDLTSGRFDYIITQLKTMYPKQVDSVINETE